MEKFETRSYISEVDACVSRSLKLWKKLSHIENGEAVRDVWQFEQALIVVDIFWKDGDEGINLLVDCPRQKHKFEWSGLTERTIENLMDRIGNLAQTIMYRYPNDRRTQG